MVSGGMSCSSSFAGNTRRSHSLLVYQGKVLLAYLHDEADGIRLSPGWWGDAYLGEGLSFTSGAVLYPVEQEFHLPGGRVIRSIFFDGGLHIRYEVTGTVSLTIRPLMTNRMVHDLSRDPVIEISDAGESLILNGCAVSSTIPFTHDMQWYLNAYYPCEQKSGNDAWEDHISPGYFSGTVHDGTVEMVYTPLALRQEPGEISRNDDDIISHAARLCIRKENCAGSNEKAGSLNREVLISIPGLLLESGKYQEAEEMIRNYLTSHRELINNTGEAFSEEADSLLWCFWALFHYIQRLPGSPFIVTIRHELEELLFRFQQSSQISRSGHLIRTHASAPLIDTPAISRIGILVETNALWILALELMEFLKLKVPTQSSEARKEFEAFWNPDTGCLYDMIDPLDPTIRSNQVIALALGLLPFDDGRTALTVLKQHLLTPYGLCTIPLKLPQLHVHDGGVIPSSGIISPWQTGFYIDALIQYGTGEDELLQAITPLWHYFLTDGAGTVPEYFEGAAPYHRGGSLCHPAGIAELIRSRSQVLEKTKERDRPSQ